MPLTPQFEAGRWAVWGEILARRDTPGSGNWQRVSGLRPCSFTVETEGTPSSLNLRIYATNAKNPAPPAEHPGALVHEDITIGGSYSLDRAHLWVRAEVVATDVPVEVNVFAG